MFTVFISFAKVEKVRKQTFLRASRNLLYLYLAAQIFNVYISFSFNLESNAPRVMGS